ncbi:MAG: ribokinase [Rhodospirillales bacterium]|nr:ribokinase [Rhodospirillales bacterium]
MLIVFGSINQDMYFPASVLPEPGKTVLCAAYTTGGGGKGANQALAAARCGAKTALVGRVGDDGMGLKMLNHIRREGVMTSGVVQSDFPTGCSAIITNKEGKRHIVVALGANADINSEQIPNDILGPGNVVLMQMEIPPDHNWDIINRAHEHGATTILNLTPAIQVPAEILAKLDYLIINELEARQIAEKLGLKMDNAALLARALAQQGQNLTCIITLGPRGSIAVTPDNQIIAVPAIKIDPVDITGAGDAYCGTLAAGLHGQVSLVDSMKRASVAATLSCLRKGGQTSFPHLDEINEKLPELGEVKIEQITD